MSINRINSVRITAHSHPLIKKIQLNQIKINSETSASSVTLRRLLILIANLEPDPAIGIDLGKNYSVVGIFKNGRVQILANSEGDFLQNSIFFEILGSRLTPCCVSYMNNKILVGETAKKQLVLNPTNTIYGNFKYLVLLSRRKHTMGHRAYAW